MIKVLLGLVLALGSFVPEALIATVDKIGARWDELLPSDDHRRIVEAFGEAVLQGIPIPLSTEESINNAKVLDA